METVLLDTNVIIAYLDSTHDHHQIARNRIESKPRKFVMSVFSTIECLVMKFSDAIYREAHKDGDGVDDPFAFPQTDKYMAALTNAQTLSKAVIEGGMIPLMEEKSPEVAQAVLSFLHK